MHYLHSLLGQIYCQTRIPKIHVHKNILYNSRYQRIVQHLYSLNIDTLNNCEFCIPIKKYNITIAKVSIELYFIHKQYIEPFFGTGYSQPQPLITLNH